MVIEISLNTISEIIQSFSDEAKISDSRILRRHMGFQSVTDPSSPLRCSPRTVNYPQKLA